MRKARTVALGAGMAAVAVAVATAMAGGATAATSAPATYTKANGPNIAIKPGDRVLKTGLSSAPTTAQCEAALGIACYTPDQVRAAFNTTPLLQHGITGKGQTIVIIDSYGSPTIASDLHTFDQTFGYSDPNLKIVTPVGAPPAWDPTNSVMTGWAGETTLDVEYSHTIAPGANIVLVETPDAETEGITGFPNIIKAEEDVISHPAAYGIKGRVDVISQSFGATEQTFASAAQIKSLRGAYEDAYLHGVTVLASTGDTGVTNYEADGATFYTKKVTGWPATDPLVTAVGGTQIHESAAGAYSQTVWNDTYDVNLMNAFTGQSNPVPFATTGGVSSVFGLPFYQYGVARTIKEQSGTYARAVPDISMSGACDGAVDFYITAPGGGNGWSLVCGTSEASPEFAGIIALASQVAGHSLGLVNPALYRLSAERAKGIVDVTSGNNTVTFTQGNPAVTTTLQGYSAGRGYDMASGVGTVNAANFVFELAAADRG